MVKIIIQYTSDMVKAFWADQYIHTNTIINNRNPRATARKQVQVPSGAPSAPTRSL